MKKFSTILLFITMLFLLVSCNDKYDYSLVLTEPPILSVEYEENKIEALRGGYKWTVYNKDGTGTSTTTDSAHPLECKEIMPTIIKKEDDFVKLKFEVEPKSVFVRVWSDKYWGDVENAEKNLFEVTVHNNVINLLDNEAGVIYEVFATWELEGYYNGDSLYSFYVKNNE